MPLTIHKHFDYLTPFEEADNDQELAEIATLKSSKACSNLEVDALFFARMVEGVKHYEAWRVLGLSSFEDFCDVRLNKTINEVEAIVAGVKALSSQGVKQMTLAEVISAAQELNPVGTNQHSGKEGRYNVTSSIEERGNSQEYLLRRLKRDAPEIAAALGRGEYRSARAAGIAAGFVKEATTLDKLSTLWGKASPDERSRFLERIVHDTKNGGTKRQGGQDIAIRGVGVKGAGAPVGTPAWADWLHRQLMDILLREEGQCATFTHYWDEFIVQQGWVLRPDAQGKPFTSYHAYARAPHPHGLGMSPEQWAMHAAAGRACTSLFGETEKKGTD